MGCTWTDLPCQFGTLQGFAPAVFKSKDVRFTTRYPFIPAMQAVRSPEAFVGMGKIAQQCPGHSIRCEPPGRYLRDPSTNGRILFKLPQILQQPRSSPANMPCEVANSRIARIARVCLSKQPARKPPSTQSRC